MTRRTASNSTFSSRHSMSLSFKALGREFSASLHHNNDLFHPRAVVSVFSEGELVETYSPQSRAYLGEATIDGKEQASISAVVADYEEGVFHMSIWSKETGESYVVEPTYLHPELSQKRSERDGEIIAGGKMVVFKEHWDELPFAPRGDNEGERDEEEEEQQFSCGTEDVMAEGEEAAGNVVDPTSSCPPRSDSYLLMGVATDNQYVKKAGGTSGTPNTISYIWSTMQGHYYTAVRNKPVIKSLVINSSPSSSSSDNFNTASCPSDVQTRLTPFCTWRTRQTDRSIGLWHLLSGCLPDRSGVAGRAYYSALCRYTTQGCGITGYLSGNARWVIPAHEIGHNYGARHSSNIMAPSVNSRATGFAQTSISDMCRYTFSVSARTACLLSSLPSGTPTVPTPDDDDEGSCECKRSSENVKADEESSATATSSALLNAMF
ncbi:hypothetical protein QOT17_012733 [Balamuthia mandrillaris]